MVIRFQNGNPNGGAEANAAYENGRFTALFGGGLFAQRAPVTQVQTLRGTAAGLQVEILARRFYESFNYREWEFAERLVHPQAVFTYVPSGQQFVGRAGYRELSRRWVTAFPDSSLSILRLRVCPGPLVQTEWVMHGTHMGILDLPGLTPMPPTEVHMHLAVRETVCIANCMIVESVMEFDPEELRSQLAG